MTIPIIRVNDNVSPKNVTPVSIPPTAIPLNMMGRATEIGAFLANVTISKYCPIAQTQPDDMASNIGATLALGTELPDLTNTAMTADATNTPMEKINMPKPVLNFGWNNFVSAFDPA